MNEPSEKHYFTLRNTSIKQKESNRSIFKIYCKNYYRRDEVSQHNALNDFWVIVNERVLDLTEFLKRFYLDNCSNKSCQVRML